MVVKKTTSLDEVILRRNVEKHLNFLYYKAVGPSFYAGSSKVLLKSYKKANFEPLDVKLSEVDKYLSKQLPYNITKRAVHKFTRNRFFTQFIGDVIAVDLVDYVKKAAFNDGYKYIFVFIDTFSKKVYTEPMKNKTPLETTRCLRKILQKFDHRVRNICVDSGTEFFGAFSKYCKKSKINLYTSEGESKNSIVERVIQTLQLKLWRYFKQLGAARWLDIIPKITASYNASVHRSIKMAPNAVSNSNSHTVFKTLFPRPHTRVGSKLQVGDIVRHSLKIDFSTKASEGRWSLAVFRIIGKKYPPLARHPMFKLERAHSKTPYGGKTNKVFKYYWFYASQLQKVDSNKFAGPDTEFELHVLETKGNESLVQWVGYDDKPEWVLTSSLTSRK